MEIPTQYNGRDYSNEVNSAIQKARTEFSYPTSNQNTGLKQTMGRGFYTMLLEQEIKRAKIPKGLKMKLIGEEKFRKSVAADRGSRRSYRSGD